MLSIHTLHPISSESLYGLLICNILFKMNTAQNDAPIMMSVAFCITSFIFQPILFASRHGWGCVAINQGLFRTCFSWNTTPCANKHTFRQSSISFKRFLCESKISDGNLRTRVALIVKKGFVWSCKNDTILGNIAPTHTFTKSACGTFTKALDGLVCFSY